MPGLPGAVKTVASFISFGATSTRYIAQDNILVGGSGMTIDVGIKCGGVDGIIRRNVIHEGASALGATAATFTVGIAANFNALVLRKHLHDGGTSKRHYWWYC